MKNLKTSLALSLSLLAAVPAGAAELSGVTMPDTVTVEGKELKLNGLGLRKKFIIKVYVAGLYVEKKSKDGAEILAADTARRVDMKMLRELDRKTIVDALKTGFEKNAGDKLPALKDSLDKFIAVVPDVKEGQTLTIIYTPEKGTRVEGTKGEAYSAAGKDFADALFSVWVGKSPVDEDLKKGMLGQ